MKPLPIISTVLMAYAGIFQNWRTLVLALVVPACCILVIEIVAAGMVTQGRLYALLTLVLTAPFYALFAIVVHRTVILGADSLPNPIGMFWSPRETRFIGWTIGLAILTFLLTFFIGFFAVAIAIAGPIYQLSLILIIGLWLIVVYIYTRLSMVFPATAIEDATSLERAWRLTEGNGIRMVIVMLLAAGPVFGLGLLILYLIPYGTVATVMDILLAFVVGAFGVCTVSVTYRQLLRIESERLGNTPDGPSNPIDEPPPSDPAGP